MAHNPEFLKLVQTMRKSRVQETDINGYKKIAGDGREKPLLMIPAKTMNGLRDTQPARFIFRRHYERDIETKVADKSTKNGALLRRGFRSALAADALRKMGYTDVISLDGGWRAWQESGMPIRAVTVTTVNHLTQLHTT